jgi:site-specific recombinase XerD
LRWLGGEDLSLDQVTRSVIVRYTRSLVEGERQLSAVSVNHRLSVLATFFAWLLERKGEAVDAGDARNPVPRVAERVLHRAAGRDEPRRERAELRRRVPVRVPRTVDADTVEKLRDAAPSIRDQAILTLLWRTGARIGDWVTEADRHGVLGLATGDVDAKRRVVRVRLKGSRDEHRVPVTDDFWTLWERYLSLERGDTGGHWAWEGRRRARGRPLRYDAFAVMLRALGRRVGVHLHAHMLRHGLAEAVVATSGLQVAQEILRHRHLGTTAHFYVRVDEATMVAGVELAARRLAMGQAAMPGTWVFQYDELTLAELGRLTDGAGWR